MLGQNKRNTNKNHGERVAGKQVKRVIKIHGGRELMTKRQSRNPVNITAAMQDDSHLQALLDNDLYQTLDDHLAGFANY